MFLKTCLPPLLGLVLLTPLAAAPFPRLVKDIATGTTQGASGLPQNIMAAAGNRVFFTQDRVDTGYELWVSDGTLQSSRLVKDIRPGPVGSAIREMVVSGNKLFFTANDGTHGWELWVSDGTEAGTRLVADLLQEPETSLSPAGLLAFKNGVAFTAYSDDGLLHLGWTDGTAANTRLLKPLVRNAESDSPNIQRKWAVLGAHLYFGSQEGPPGGSDTALWRTDGTAKGTTLVKLFPQSIEPVMAGVVGSTLYFSAHDANLAIWSLWKTNGTPSGTVLVSDFEGQLTGSNISEITGIGNKGFFPGGYYLGGGLWQTDGTAAGTKIALPPVSDTLPAVLGSQLLVAASTEGPVQISLLNPKTLAQTPVATGDPGRMSSNGKQAWYFKNDRLFLFDGKKETDLGIQFYNPTYFTSTADGYFFVAQQDGGPSGVWKAPAKAPFTPVCLSPSVPAAAGSFPGSFATAAGKQFFAAKTAAHGEELWVSDGTEAGTKLVKDIYPGTTGSQPRSLVGDANGIVYFSANSPDHGNELWRSDGTEAGTWMLTDLQPGTGSSVPQHLTLYAGRVIFSARVDMKNGLWAIDSMQGGAQAVALNMAVWDADNSRLLTVFGDSLYVLGSRRIDSPVPHLGPIALHRVTESAGELQIAQLGPDLREARELIIAPALSQPGHPDQLYYIGVPQFAQEGAVYRCDGINAPVPLNVTFDSNEQLESLTLGDGRVVLRTTSLSIYDRIWVTSATDDSLTLLAEGTVVGGTDDAIYYSVWDSFSPGPLQLNRIRADGTGLTVVKKTPPGTRFNQVQSTGSALFFDLFDPTTTVHTLWITQGTPETTRQIPDLISDGFWQTSLDGDTLYLGARLSQAWDTPGLGQELYALDLPGVAFQFTQITGDGPVWPLWDADQDTLTFIQAVGQSRTVTLQITNTGLRTATDVNLSAPVPALADFTFNVTSLGDLAPGQTAQVHITFTPAAAGLQEGEFTVSASGVPAIELELQGAGLGGDSPPAVGTLPPLILAAIGDTLTLKADYVVPGAMPFFRWRQISNGTGRDVGTQQNLSLAPVKPDSYGTYSLNVSNAHGSALSTSAAVAVFRPLPAVLKTAEGKTFTLACPAAGPKGSTITYQWLRDGLPLADFDRISGSQTRELTVTDVKAADARTYSCLVTFTFLGQSISRSSGETEVAVLAKPEWVIFDTGLENFKYRFIGEDVSTHTVEFLNADSITVKGLPPGLQWKRATSNVVGRPTKTGLFPVTFTATNVAGSTVQILHIHVAPTLEPGSYDGLVERVPAVGDAPGFGSRVLLTATTTGTLSGQLFHDGKVYRFASQATTPGYEQEGAALTLPARILVPRGKGLPGIVLTFRGLDVNTFTLKDLSTGTETTGLLRRPVFSKTVPATAYAGPYNIILDSEETGPAGCGFLTATIAKTGIITWKGKLADGTVLTGSSAISARPSEQASLMAFALHQDLYKATGSLHGWVEMPGLAPDPQPVMISGRLTWNKAPLPATSKERNYKEGIPVHEVGAFGGSYQAPDEGGYIMHLGEGPDNGTMAIQADSIPGPQGLMTQSFTATLKHKAELPALSAGTFLKSLTLDAKKGTFKGTVVIPHADPKLVRTAAFEGIMDPVINNQAIGFFLLPDLPAEGPPATTLGTSPLKSALIQILP